MAGLVFAVERSLRHSRGAARRRRRRLRTLTAACLLSGACAGEEDRQWPARNYSGTFAVRAVGARNDCAMPPFARGDTVLLEVRQDYRNHVGVRLSPVVSMTGSFRGDHLTARAAVLSPAMPDAVAADSGVARAPGATAQDGIAGSSERAGESRDAPAADSLRYALELDFDGESVEGEYRVEQPALGEGVPACSQTFRFEGVQVAGPDGVPRQPGGAGAGGGV